MIGRYHHPCAAVVTGDPTSDCTPISRGVVGLVQQSDIRFLCHVRPSSTVEVHPKSSPRIWFEQNNSAFLSFTRVIAPKLSAYTHKQTMRVLRKIFGAMTRVNERNAELFCSNQMRGLLFGCTSMVDDGLTWQRNLMSLSCTRPTTPREIGVPTRVGSPVTTATQE